METIMKKTEQHAIGLLFDVMYVGCECAQKYISPPPSISPDTCAGATPLHLSVGSLVQPAFFVATIISMRIYLARWRELGHLQHFADC
jgi:hypothetical protein